MNHNDEFRPRLGRSASGKREPSYLRQVMRGVNLAGGFKRSGKRFDGSRIGRGAGAGRVLASRDQYASFRTRRVVVKSRIVKSSANGLKAARLHLNYIQRDGVTREGEPGQLYDAEHDRADGKEFLERSVGDRHQFRFIVSPEDGIRYDELHSLTRRLMEQMEEDLGTGLDWVAVDHFNTGHPHTHVVLRGRDDLGKDLIIAREYLSHGIRERAAEIVSIDLGPRSDLEIEDRLRNEVSQERFTSLDRSLLRDAGENGTVAAVGEDPFRQSLRAGRLQQLKNFGLAEEISPGKWQLAEDLEPVLRRMGERGDIIRTLHREMTQSGREGRPLDYAIYDPTDETAKRIVGCVVGRGLSDEVKDHHYIVVDGLDGRTHYIDTGRSEIADGVPKGAIVAVEPKSIEPRTADRIIAEVARANGGRYDMNIHMRHDPRASLDYTLAHERRLEAMRRIGGNVERGSDGKWVITADHLEKARAYEQAQAKLDPVVIETLSSVPVSRQIGMEGATWLDRELIANEPTLLRKAGFGYEVSEALAQRQRWLVQQGLMQIEGDQVSYRTHLLSELRSRELARAGSQLSKELGLRYAEAKSGERIEGTYKGAVDLSSGKFAVIEKSREFTLVPWRPILERNLGQSVSGIMRDDTISWTLGRQRGGPSIG
jgi:type IV secretory pathway VirD2 relaxase